MMTPPTCDLAATTHALERGNWPILTPTALRRSGPDEGRAELAAIQLDIADSMRAQALGRLVWADDHLDTAAQALPSALRHRTRGRWFAVLPAPPRNDEDFSLLLWRTAQVIFREQHGLDEHRARLRPGRLSPHEILVVAYVEFLRWVACDYFLTVAGVDIRGVRLDVRSALLRDRATDLCQLADPTAASLTEGVWRAAGGTARLVAEALDLLAAEALVPREGPGSLPETVPVRCGRVEARRRALQRRTDLDHAASR